MNHETSTAEEVNRLKTGGVIDYLDKPPQRYEMESECSLDPMNATMEPAPDGEWVKFSDMDLYMFEGAQLMQQSLAEIERLRTALTAAQQRIATMRAKLLELAGGCAKCGGSGETTIRGMCGGVEMDCDNQPCPHCADIREAAR